MTENEELATYIATRLDDADLRSAIAASRYVLAMVICALIDEFRSGEADYSRLCFMCHRLDHDGPCLPLDVRQSGALAKIPVRSS
jgi:hypothetical protein